tara:strand:+ start:17525 stop:18817 length:1293 start_codon:yes stop_codon:yes gene_type:complete
VFKLHLLFYVLKKSHVILDDGFIEYFIYAENNTIGKFSPTNAEHEFYSVKTAKSDSSDLVINEFLASNTASNADQDGEFDDWIELFNNGISTIDLSIYSLSDDISDLTQFTFPANTMLQPDSFVVVWADNDVAQAGFHADFKLSSGGETIYLSDASLSIVDSVTFPAQLTDISYGRFVNGTGTFQFLTPIIGDQNMVTIAPSYDVVINEFLASNTTDQSDSYGDFDNWIELYNKGNSAVDLSSFSISDDIADLDLYKFASGTILAPDSFIIVWADGDSAQILATVGYHADFKLSASGESIYLTDGSTIVDSVTYPTQVTDTSYGRWPNGTGSFASMAITFRAQNSNHTGLNKAIINTVEFSIYPNPATESFTVRLNEFKAQPTTVHIFNNMGQQLFFNTINQFIDVNTSTWVKGIYFVRVGLTTSRIIIQ